MRFKINKKINNEDKQFIVWVHAIEVLEIPGSKLTFFLHESADSYSALRFNYVVSESLSGSKVYQEDTKEEAIIGAFLLYHMNGGDKGLLTRVLKYCSHHKMVIKNKNKIKTLLKKI